MPLRFRPIQLTIIIILATPLSRKRTGKAAVDAYKQSLLRNPGDLDAKENYAYAKQMLKNEAWRRR